ncbi:MAG TPA: chlorite dismutase family protein [Fimbriimonadaceae bacterium]|jgi:chlorite dismutase
MDQKPVLNLYASFAYTKAFWNASSEEQLNVKRTILTDSARFGDATHLYSVYPTRTDIDFMLWTAKSIEEPGQSADFFIEYARILEPVRKFIKPAETLWGFTKPSMYARGKSEQDIDPFIKERNKFLVIYPFSKNKEWYLMSFDARQGMMNEHIKLGKQYFDIKQLLLYSFGLQDHEFVVSYEVDELPRFSQLVQELRSTEGRKYTLLDSPIITCTHMSEEQFLQ